MIPDTQITAEEIEFKLQQYQKLHFQDRLMTVDFAAYMKLWFGQMNAAIDRKDRDAVYKLIPLCPFLPIKEVYRSFSHSPNRK